MQQILKDYLEVHGYWVLFLGTFFEGEAILIFAGLLAFQGYLNIFGVILSALAGSFLGDQVYFYLGRRKGAFLLKLFTSFSRNFRKALRFIERYGSLVAFLSRYTYGLRILLPVVLGMTSFSSRKFLYLNLLSALSWSIVFAMGGYLFGKSASFFVDDLERYEPYLLMALGGLICCVWIAHYLAHLWRRRKACRRLKRRRESKRLAELEKSDTQ